MRVLQSIAFILVLVQANAQARAKTLSTDSGAVVLHYFVSGELSTKEWMDKDDRWGRSLAWAKDGRELMNYQTRRIGGQASVTFSYHANGGISKAEVSDAPDGGIQWYRSTTTFDENGDRTGFTEQGRDNDGPIPGLDVRVLPAPEVTIPVQLEEVKEQRMFVNEVFLVNPTQWTCKVNILVDRPSPALNGGERTIEPGDTLRIGVYSAGEIFQPPENYVRIAVYRKLRKTGYFKMSHFKTNIEQPSPEHRRYYKVMHGWVSTRKIW